MLMIYLHCAFPVMGQGSFIAMNIYFEANRRYLLAQPWEGLV